MNTAIVIHLIGTLALISILFTTILYTSIRMNQLRYENERRILQSIANSLTYQILTVFMVETNNSISPNYPVVAIYDRGFNIVIASGGKINELYRVVSGLNNSYIYVLVIDQDNQVYAYRELLPNSSNRPIYIREFLDGRSCSSNNTILFSSNTIVYIWKYEYDYNIVLSCELKGLKQSEGNY